MTLAGVIIPTMGKRLLKWALNAKYRYIMKTEEQNLFFILESSVLFDDRLKDKEKILYSIICFYSNNGKGYCYLKNSQLIEMMKITKKYFYTMIKNLTRVGYIKSIKAKNRSYLSPLAYSIYIEAAEKRKKEHEEVMEKIGNKNFDYDWLNEEEN